MKQFLILLICFVAGCSNNDTGHAPKSPVGDANINGEILFKANCASCHKCDKDFTGPALNGSLQRWGNDKKAMYEFIRNPAKSVVENAYAKQLYEKWNRTMMTSFNLSDIQIDSILNYCENYVNKAIVKQAARY